MSVSLITQYISIGIPIVAFASLAVALFLFVRTKGTVDALKEAADTYKTLAEAYQAQIEQLEAKIDQLETQITNLERNLEVQREAIRIAVDEFLKAQTRADR